MLKREKNTNTVAQNIIICSFLFLLSALFLIIHSTSTSPLLFRSYGTDSPIFMSMGKFFYEGATPYVDFFDHKGPIIIFIQALAAALFKDVRHGAFLLQVFSLSFTLIIIYKTIRPFLSTINSFTVIVLFLTLFSRFISGGNLTEEYCMFVSFLTLYYCFNFLENRYILSSGSYFIIGLSFAFSFWIRANNAAVIVACLLFMFIILIRDRSYNELKKMIIYVLFGIAAISLPIILYFLYIGAFNEMIDATFVVNFDYLLKANQESTLVSDTGDTTSLDFYIFSLLPFVVLIAGAIMFYFYYKVKEIVILSVCLSIICYLATLTGHPFLHYLILNLPCFVLGLFMLLYIIERRHKVKYQPILLVFSALILLVFSTITTKRSLSVSEENERPFEQIIEIIPNVDYNSVFTYEVGAEFYLMIDALPYCKYYILQEWQSEKLKRKSIFDEINNTMTAKPPKWVVLNREKDINNTRLLEIINTNYNLILRENKLELYRRKDV